MNIFSLVALALTGLDTLSLNKSKALVAMLFIKSIEKDHHITSLSSNFPSFPFLFSLMGRGFHYLLFLI